jgi:hypothetical protein
LAEPAKADEAAAERDEGFVDVVAAVVSDEQPLEVVEPGEGALDDPASTAQAGAVLCLAAGDLRRDPALAQLSAVAVVVVAAVGGDPLGPLARPQSLPHARLLSLVQAAVAGRARAEAELQGQMPPNDPRMQHKQNSL